MMQILKQVSDPTALDRVIKCFSGRLQMNT